MSNFLESKKVRAILWTLGGLIILFMEFGLGVSIGYERAGFATGSDRNYYRIFFGGAPPRGLIGLIAPSMPVAVHGVVGTVLDLSTSTILVKDWQGNEKSVAVSSGTDIRSGNGSVSIGSVTVGDMIAAIGEPNSLGQIDARFIRIFPASSSIPMPQP